MPRFFVPSEQFYDDAHLYINGADAHHISYSLRMAVGEELTVCDMKKNELTCRITAMDGERVELEVLSHLPAETEPPLEITLYQAYPKGDKLETIVQKAVETGAFAVVPFISERCIKRPHAEKSPKQTARLSSIAAEAAKQCGRGILPTVSEPLTYGEMLAAAAGADLFLFCYEGDGTVSIREVLASAAPTVRTVALVVGSEGGFSLAEVERAKARGAVAVGLGKRILRCETAPVFALSCICCLTEL